MLLQLEQQQRSHHTASLQACSICKSRQSRRSSNNSRQTVSHQRAKQLRCCVKLNSSNELSGSSTISCLSQLSHDSRKSSIHAAHIMHPLATLLNARHKSRVCRYAHAYYITLHAPHAQRCHSIKIQTHNAYLVHNAY
jgi:hypothetical protein